MKKSLLLPFGMGALVIALLLTGAIALPQQALAWSAPCQLGTFDIVTSDITVLPNGTVYGVFFASQGNSNFTTIYRWDPPSCAVTRVTGFTDAESDPLGLDIDAAVAEPESIHGPVQSARPDIDSNANGDIVVAYRIGNRFPYSVWFARKPAGSASFSAPVRITPNGYAGDVKLDQSGNVHVTYYRSANPGTPGGFYQKFNAANQSVVGPIQLTEYHDSEPELDVDAQGNAHTAYSDNQSYDLRYRRIASNGAVGPEQTITTQVDAFYPYVSVDTQNNLHFVMEGRTGGGDRQIFYRKCNSQGTGCGNFMNISQASGNNAFDGHIVTCGTVPYISWYYDDDAGGNQVLVSKNLQAGDTVAGVGNVSAFNVLAPGSGFINVVYRGPNSKAFFSRQQEPGCTSTAQPTKTPKPSNPCTPDTGPTPTPRAGKIPIDDCSALVTYNGEWQSFTNQRKCLTDRTVHKTTKPKKNSAEFTFEGTQVRVWFLRSPGGGTAQVLIDGQMANGNLDMSGDKQQCDKWTSQVLPPGEHTIVVRPKSKTDGVISLDAFTIYIVE